MSIVAKEFSYKNVPLVRIVRNENDFEVQVASFNNTWTKIYTHKDYKAADKDYQEMVKIFQGE